MPQHRIRKTSDPLTIRILDSLGAEWQPYQEFIRKMAEFVPGEVAYRTAEKQRSYSTDQPRRIGDMTAIILSGSRTYVRKRLEHLRYSGRIEVEYEAKKVYKKPVRLRLTPAEVEIQAAAKVKEKDASTR